MFDITPLVLLLVAAVIAGATFVTRKYVKPFIESQMTYEERKNLYDAVVIGVAAAEQLYKTGIIKKDERVDRVYEFLEKNNITFDHKVVADMIEAAVLDLPKTALGIDEKDEKTE